MDEKFRKEQAGFRKGSGCIDQMFALRYIIEQCRTADLMDLIKTFYTNFKCRVGNSSLAFQVKTGVRQGRVMSALLFNIVIDWVMRRTTEDKTRGIRWTLFSLHYITSHYIRRPGFGYDMALG